MDLYRRNYMEIFFTLRSLRYSKSAGNLLLIIANFIVMLFLDRETIFLLVELLH